MRNIVCESCAAKRPVGLHPEDAAMGFQKRVVKLLAKKPADHAISINGIKQAQMETLQCDSCGQSILDGQPAVAISMWRGDAMAEWEQEYGEVVL